MTEISAEALAALTAKLYPTAQPASEDQPQDDAPSAVDTDTAAAIEGEEQSTDDGAAESSEPAAAEDLEDPEPEAQPEREYFVRTHETQNLSINAFNKREGLRWLGDHLGIREQQPTHPDVAPGHFASADVSDAEFAAEYERLTGRRYQPRSATVVGHTAL